MVTVSGWGQRPTFTRQQWLSSVCSCRSKLRTGFPTDHYALVPEIQIKLAARSKRSPARRKLDLSKVSINDRYAYNQKLKQGLGLSTEQDPVVPDNTPAKVIFYTDGSGSRGRCTGSTPAGWGWCYQHEDSWREAKGPVITSPDHTAFLGARVGSNNTGELSAIAEALLYARENEINEVVVKTDSRWSINVITGKWRQRTHHDLINKIRDLMHIPHFTCQGPRRTRGQRAREQTRQRGAGLARIDGRSPPQHPYPHHPRRARGRRVGLFNESSGRRHFLHFFAQS